LNWEAVIGLEIHIQLATATKIFSSAPTAYGAAPNTQAAAGDIALPGVLPVINADVIRMAVLFGLAIEADIAPTTVFERKHYFYPDLPAGYQRSQLALPIVANGHLDIPAGAGAQTKRIGITRAHLEEDAGKSLHEAFAGATGIDLNRAGMPLIECVSEPDMATAAQAAAYARKLHSLVTYLGICDGNMAEGSFRVDANVSVRSAGASEFGTRTETKNVNSFRFLEKAIAFEIERQIDVLEGGGTVVQETRLFDPDSGITRTMRTKETAEDYRYFPDPDLLPVAIDAAFIEAVRAAGMLPVGLAYGDSQTDALAQRMGLPVIARFREAFRQTGGASAPAPTDAPAPDPAPTETAAAATTGQHHPGNVRSGQQVYARDRDLVITATVANGAEVIADGSIHIYGTLRGRALAGAQGDPNARIFCTDFRPELVSIAGHYRVFEEVPRALGDRAVQCRLDGEKLRVEKL
jgi:aspartyl-tRNA(Asn)/glutamyl-tRNA(Gln) amidotransferase subunit B